MTEHPLPQPPRLSGTQRLWLLEIGLDRPMLARLSPDAALAVGTARARPVPGGTAENDGANPALATLDASPKGGKHGGSAHSPDASAERANAMQAMSALLKKGDAQVGLAAAGQQASRSQAFGMRSPTTSSAGRAADGNEPVKQAPVSDWAALDTRIQACEACGLQIGRQKAVPGAGATESGGWLVVGEAPGERDDRLGVPFQGKAGELLHAMLGAAGIDPENAVFYTNLVKCRPRSNRPPSPEEINACLPHLRSQIALLRPRGILALGRLAAQALVADGKPFEEQRGRVHAFQTEDGRAIPMVVTYHPASLLSRPRHKAASWRDLNLAIKL